MNLRERTIGSGPTTVLEGERLVLPPGAYWMELELDRPVDKVVLADALAAMGFSAFTFDVDASSTGAITRVGQLTPDRSTTERQYFIRTPSYTDPATLQAVSISPISQTISLAQLQAEADRQYQEELARMFPPVPPQGGTGEPPADYTGPGPAQGGFARTDQAAPPAKKDPLDWAPTPEEAEVLARLRGPEEYEALMRQRGVLPPEPAPEGYTWTKKSDGTWTLVRRPPASIVELPGEIYRDFSNPTAQALPPARPGYEWVEVRPNTFVQRRLDTERVSRPIEDSSTTERGLSTAEIAKAVETMEDSKSALSKVPAWAWGLGGAALATAATLAVIGNARAPEWDPEVDHDEVSGASPYTFRIVARLKAPIAIENLPGRWWKTVRRIPFEPFSPLDFQFKPWTLREGQSYTMRMLSRDKTAATRARVRELLGAMGFETQRLIALRRNVHVPGRPGTSMTLWLAAGTWGKPDSIVTVGDVFFFETMRESE